MRTNFCHVVKQRLIYFCLFSLLYRTRNRAMEDGFKRNKKTNEKKRGKKKEKKRK